MTSRINFLKLVNHDIQEQTKDAGKVNLVIITFGESLLEFLKGYLFEKLYQTLKRVFRF